MNSKNPQEHLKIQKYMSLLWMLIKFGLHLRACSVVVWACRFPESDYFVVGQSFTYHSYDHVLDELLSYMIVSSRKAVHISKNNI